MVAEQDEPAERRIRPGVRNGVREFLAIVQLNIFTMTRDGRLLLAPELARALLTLGMSLSIPAAGACAPTPLVQATAMRIREDEEISTLAVHRFEQRHEIWRFIEHQPILEGRPTERPETTRGRPR